MPLLPPPPGSTVHNWCILIVLFNQIRRTVTGATKHAKRRFQWHGCWTRRQTAKGKKSFQTPSSPHPSGSFASIRNISICRATALHRPRNPWQCIAWVWASSWFYLTVSGLRRLDHFYPTTSSFFQKRKKTTDSGKAAKKYKEFKFWNFVQSFVNFQRRSTLAYFVYFIVLI